MPLSERSSDDGADEGTNHGGDRHRDRAPGHDPHGGASARRSSEAGAEIAEQLRNSSSGWTRSAAWTNRTAPHPTGSRSRRRSSTIRTGVRSAWRVSRLIPRTASRREPPQRDCRGHDARDRRHEVADAPAAHHHASCRSRAPRERRCKPRTHRKSKVGEPGRYANRADSRSRERRLAAGPQPVPNA